MNITSQSIIILLYLTHFANTCASNEYTLNPFDPPHAFHVTLHARHATGQILFSFSHVIQLEKVMVSVLRLHVRLYLRIW